MMSLEKCAGLLNKNVEELELSDLEFLVSAGYEPVAYEFTLPSENRKYKYVPAIIQTDEDFFNDVPESAFGYLPVMFSVQDENLMFVDRNSITKIGNEYYYSPYQKLEDGCVQYSNLNRVEEAIDNLNLHSRLGGLNHTFTVITTIGGKI